MSRMQDIAPGRRAVGRILLGCLAIVAGLLLLGHNLGYFTIQVSYRLWPLILVALGLVKLVEKGPLSGGGHWLVFLGLFLLAGFLEREDLIERWWPLAVIWFGLLVSARALIPGRRPAVCEDQSERKP